MTNNIILPEDSRNGSTDYGPLTIRQAENIADLAAKRAQDRLYAEIGRSVVTKVLWALGIACGILVAWVNGWVKFGPKS